MLDFEIVPFVTIYLILFIIYTLRKASFKVVFLHSLVFVYLVAIASVTLFPIPINHSGIEAVNNFIPLFSLFNSSFKELLMNILLFIPLGFFLPLIWKSTVHTTVIVGLIFSLSIEIIQFLISSFMNFTYKSANIDDVVFCFVGVMIGKFLSKRFTRSEKL